MKIMGKGKTQGSATNDEGEVKWFRCMIIWVGCGRQGWEEYLIGFRRQTILMRYRPRIHVT